MESLHAFSEIKANLSHLLPEYVASVEKAFELARSAHMGQYRLSGDPYITHPLGVADILAGLKLDHETIIAGLLHDVVEDTSVSIEKIEALFGENVALIVEGVTKMRRFHYSNVESYYAENYRKMFMAMANDIRVIFVKLADRLHNMRTSQAMPLKSKARIARETLDVYAPIANRLGMHNLSLELYELGFAACYPLRYQLLLERMYRFNAGHANVLAHLKVQIEEQGKAQGIKIVDIASREKRIYGIYEKMREKRMKFSDVMDVYALRICVENVHECYHLLGIIHSLYRPKERLFKDYIASPKENGYQSLHTVLYGPHGLSIEIQIRTEEMHLVATKGIAAHWLYKSGTSTSNQRRQQNWFKRLVEVQETCSSDAEYLNLVKQRVYLDEVYVLTPKGKVLELKKGATVLDMAYHIHTDVGNHAVYAEVDRVAAPLNQELRNGQKVHVYTDSKVFPKEQWLDVVVTAKARSAIRASLKDRKVLTERRIGQQILRRALYMRGVLGDLKEETLSRLIKVLNLKSVDLLYEKIAMDGIQMDQVLDHYIHLNRQTGVVSQKEITIKSEGDGVEISSCCYPLPGDRILAAVVDEKVYVHRETCRNARRLAGSVFRAKWETDPLKTFPCVLRVTTSARAKNLAYVVSVLSDMKTEIRNVWVEDGSGELHYFFTLKVRSLEHLALVIQSLNQVRLVHLVKRELRCGSLLLAQD